MSLNLHTFAPGNQKFSWPRFFGSIMFNHLKPHGIMKDSISIFEETTTSRSLTVNNNGGERVMKHIRRFQHEQFGEITTITDENGKVWFKASEIASALGYTNPQKAVRDHGKGVNETFMPSSKGLQMTKLIGESDIYRLVMRSKLPYAERFQDWVYEEVLPAIRKHGAYMTDVTIERLLTSPELVIGLATQLKEERAARVAAESRATYTERVLSCPDLVDITQIAQDYGMTAIRMNLLLHELGVQFKDNEQWILYAKYKDKGYVQSRTFLLSDGRCKMHTRWTQRGRLFLYELLKENDILPLIER